MTNVFEFTDLECILLGGFIGVAYLNHRLSKEIRDRTLERYRMIGIMQEVADGILSIRRRENGVEIVKKSSNQTAVPPGEGGQGNS